MSVARGTGGSASDTGTNYGDGETASVVTGTVHSGATGPGAAADQASVLSADPELFARAGASRRSVNRKAMYDYEPSVDWFIEHKYFSPDVSKNIASSGITQTSIKSPSASAVPSPRAAGTPSASSAPQELTTAATAQHNATESGAFFPSAAAMAKRNNEELQALCDKYGKKEHNLSALHAMMYPLVTADGRISLDNFRNVIRGISVPGASVDFAAVWFMHHGVPVDGYLSYEDILGGLDELLNGKYAEKTAQACFSLCDTTKSKYILKDVIKGIRPRETADGQLEDQNAESPHLTYLVVKAVLRAFEHVAIAEEERVRAAQSKGRKKKKNQPLVMPSKRQFHISLKEFTELLQKDPYLVVAFLPYAMMVACDVLE